MRLLILNQTLNQNLNQALNQALNRSGLVESPLNDTVVNSVEK